MKLTDGKKTVEIRMMTWEGDGYTPDWSIDFFSAGSLPYDDANDTYIVQDVDYCIDQANDWKQSIGDFCDDTPNEDNCVFVDELPVDKTVYRVLPEHWSSWGSQVDESTTMTVVDIARLAREWAQDGNVRRKFRELLEQVEEV